MWTIQVLIFISLIVIILLVISSIFLKRIKQQKYIGVVSGGLILISITIIVSSFFVGGWAGMGYELIGLSILIGAIIGSVISSLIIYYGKNEKSK